MASEVTGIYTLFSADKKCAMPVVFGCGLMKQCGKIQRHCFYKTCSTVV